MLLLNPKPRTELALTQTALGRWALPNWGRQVGSDTGKIIAPETMNPGRNFDPINMLIFGRRGQGKTLAVTSILSVFDRAFWDAQTLGNLAGVRRTCSNYWVRFSQERGPLGYGPPGYHDLPNGEVVYGQMPVDPCDPDLPFRMSSFPEWGRHRLMAIDEIADVLNSGMAMSRVVRDWASVFRQQRKMFTEYLAATQLPQQVARNAVVTQIDLMALIKPHFRTWSADLLVFDIHGQFTGRWGRHQYLPPREGEHDWEIGIEGMQFVKDDYNTFEVVPPSWSKDRASIIQRQYRGKPTFARSENIVELEAEPSPNDPSTPAAPPPVEQVAIIDEGMRALSDLRRPFTLEDARRALNPVLGRRVSSFSALTEWLEERGWQVYQDKSSGDLMVNRS